MRVVSPWAALLLVLAALLAAPVHAQTVLWTAALTVGGDSGPHGYCSADCTRGRGTGAGSGPLGGDGLSPDVINVSGSAYTVRAIRWGANGNGRLFFELDALPAAEVYEAWTLHIGAEAVPLSERVAGFTDGNSETFPTGFVFASGWNDAAFPARGSTVTVSLTVNPGIVLSETNITTNEGGLDVTVTVSLRTAPTAPVVLRISSSDPGEVAPAPVRLTFTAADWNTNQTFRAEVSDDSVDDGDQPYTITVASASSDAGYNGLTATISGVHVDNDEPAPDIALSTTEITTVEPSVLDRQIPIPEGAQVTWAIPVSLTTMPSATVTLSLSSSNTAEATVSPAALAFAPADWNTEQTITVTGVDDDVDDDGQSYIITVLAASTDTDYSGLTATISGRNGDDDVRGIGLFVLGGAVVGTVGTTVSTSEGGDPARVLAFLRSEPTAPVTVMLSSSDPTEAGVEPASVVFTPESWRDPPQEFTVTGVDDDVDDGDKSYAITMSFTSDDSKYDISGDALPRQLPGVNADDDEAGIDLRSPIPGRGLGSSTSERESTEMYVVSLMSEPASAVTLLISSSDESEALAAPPTLTFTQADWDTRQTFSVTGVDDNVEDGFQDYTITVLAASEDPDYEGQSERFSASNIDNDNAGIVLSETNVATDESGGAATVMVSLMSEPTSEVTLMFVSSDPDEAVASPPTLTFMPGNWNTNQPITVTGQDDGVDDGQQSYMITVGAASGDSNYNEETAEIAGVNLERGVAAADNIVLSETNVATSEGGGAATVMVSLMSRPTSEVTLSISSSDEGEAVAGPAALTFAPGNWGTNQTITVTGRDDDVDDGQQGYIIAVRTTSGDSSYNDLTAEISGVNGDDDKAGIVLPEGSVSTSESGATAVVMVSLMSEPTATVTLSITSPDVDEATVSPSALTFTPANWDTEQRFTVTGQDDGVADGLQQSYMITVQATSGDSGYNGLVEEISGVNFDYRALAAGIEVYVGRPGVLGGSTLERGTEVKYTVLLMSEPTSAVTLSITSSDIGEAVVVPATLTFMPAAWDVEQTFTVTGVDDDVADGFQSYTIRVAAASDDVGYSTRTVERSVSNIDDDDAGIVVPEGVVSTDEGGSTAEVMVSLMSEPTATVMLSITSSDVDEATVSPPTLTFTPADWDMKQTFTVTGVDDVPATADNSNQIYTITVAASGGDYEGRTATISGINIDDDIPNISLRPGRVSTDEGGGTDTVMVSLTTVPTAAVTLTVTSSAPGEAVADAALTFGTGDWSTSQPFTVTGVNDDVDDGDQVYTIRVQANSADGGYDTVAAEISGVNVDDDEAGIVVLGTSVRTDESGGTDTVEMSLMSEPTAVIRLTFASSDSGEATAGPDLSFRATNWDVPQTLTVTGQDDGVRDGDQPYTITVGVFFSSDRVYSTLTATISGINVDDDIPDISLDRTSVSTDEGGGEATVMVSLTTLPTSEVTLALSSSDMGEARVSPEALTFAPADWDTPQPITVAGQDDGADDGDRNYTITVAATSGDIGYNGLSAEISGVNADDDEPPPPPPENVIWSADLTAGSGSGSIRGVCRSCVANGNRNYGSLSDHDFEFSGVAYDVDGVVWRTRGSAWRLDFELDMQLQPPTETLDMWTLEIDGRRIDFSDRTGGLRAHIYRFDDGLRGWSPPADGGTITVRLLAPPPDPGIVVSETSVTTEEDGAEAAVMVSLMSEPTSEVTLTLSSSDPEEAAVGPTELTFAAADWNTDQPFTVTGVNDHVDDGDKDYAITVLASSGDGRYDGLTAEISGVNVDDDEAGIVVPEGSVSTDEGGGTATVEVSLSSEPTAAVTLTITSSDPGEADVSPTELTFTADDWDTGQPITVTGVDDGAADGNQSYTIMVEASGGDYEGLTATVSGVNADDDIPNISLQPGNVSTDESGGAATVMVSLTTMPTMAVTVAFMSSDAGEATVSPTELMFTPADSGTSQPVTVTGADDAVADGAQSYTIAVTLTSGDSDYNGLTAEISGVNADDDEAGLVLSPTSVTTGEDGTEAEVMVSLRSEPTATVTVTIISSDRGEADALLSELTFAPTVWNTPQTITVVGIDDDVDDGDLNYEVVVFASGGDYGGQAATISGVNVDNDSSGVGFFLPAGSVAGTVSTSEGGGSAVVQVFLRSEPTATVTLSLVSAGLEGGRLVGSDEATVEPVQLTFTTTNWRPPQQFTVTGRDDDVADGDQNYVIAIASASDDGNYSRVPIAVLPGVNADDDMAGIDLSPTSVTTGEVGTEAEVMVSLRSEPTATVTLTLSSSDPGEAALVGPTELTFAPADWDTEQTFTVGGVSEAVADGDQNYAITVEATSADGDYDGEMATVSGVNVDDDEAGIDLSPTSVATDESGGTATVSVSLSSEPTATVTLTFTSDDETEAVVGPAALTFAPADWNTEQPITVTGQDDNEADRDQSYTIAVVASGGDYGGQTAAISGINADDDIPNLSLQPGNVSTDESGGATTVLVSLTTMPSAAVTLFVLSSDETEAAVSPTELTLTLTFTAADWNRNQTFTVTGRDDDVDDGDQNYIITAGLGSGDGNYDGLFVEIPGVNADDDVAGIVVPERTVSTGENGGTDTVAVSLRSEPTAQVVLTGTSSDTGEAMVSPPALTFGTMSGTGGWDTAQTFTVTGVDDDGAHGDQDYTITVGATSADPLYATLTEEISGVNIDDDIPNISLQPANVSTDESGGTDTVMVSLTTMPTMAVTVAFTSSDTGEATVSPTELMFGPGSGSRAWNRNQTVTVTGVDDDVDDGDEDYTITVRASSGDIGYATVTAAISGTNADNDAAGLILSPTSVSTDEGGGTDTVEVSLMSEPTRAVTLRLSSSDTGEARVSPPALTFRAGNWDTRQTVTVTGRNDDVDDGDQDYTITVTPRSGDGNYAGLSPEEIPGVNVDDDMAGFVLDPADGDSLGTIAEDGGRARFTAVLGSEPFAGTRVVLGVAPSSDRVGLSPAALTFTSSNWSRLQTVTVRGVANDSADGDATVEVTVSVDAAATTDPGYTAAGLASQSLSVLVEDDNSPGFSLGGFSGSGLGTIAEDGGRTRFTAVLRSEPAGTVVLGVASSTARVTLSPAALTFGFSDWNITQTVTVSAVDNDRADGDAVVVVGVSVVAADTTDPDYTNTMTVGTQILNVAVEDDDEAGIVVPGRRVSTNEGGGTDTVAVSLRSEPTSAVTLTFASSAPDEATAGPALTFGTVSGAGGWDTAQTFTVTGVDDAAADRDQDYTITVGAVSGDSGYSGLTEEISGINADDDMPNIYLDRTSVSTDEGGGTDTVMVSLTTEPSAAVTLMFASSDDEEATVAPAALTFGTVSGAGGWDTAQPVMVTGVNDDVADGEQSYTIAVRASSGDPDYNRMAAEIAGVNADDGDEAGIVVSPTSVSTDEGGGAATVMVSLMSEPTRVVTLRIASSDTDEATVRPAALTFAPADWNTNRAFTVTGEDDDVVAANPGYTITVTPRSRDGVYNRLPPEEISGVNADDDMAGFTLAPADGSGLGTIPEDGGTARFTAVLGSEPAAGTRVVLGVAPSSNRVSLLPAALTFAASNWDRPQTVTVRGVSNDLADGDATVEVAVSVAAAPATTDPGYTAAGLAAQSLSVAVEDDNSPGFSLGGFSGSGLGAIAEDGGRARFTAVLRSEPSGTVVLGVAPSRARITLSPAALTFDSSNWDSAQTVTVSAVDNDRVDGDAVVVVGVSVVAADTTDTDYTNTMTVGTQILNVAVEDDDEAGIVLPGRRVSTNEGGGTDRVAVSLRSEPTAAVMLTFASSAPDEAMAGPALTFGTEDWNVPQTFTVTGVNDVAGDGDQDYTITVGAVSGDSVYNGLTEEISGTNDDDDMPNIYLDRTSVATDESGGTDTVMVSLTTMPTLAVTLSISSSDPGEATVSPSALTFGTGDWSTAQPVTVTGVDDAVDDGNEDYTIAVRASSGDGGYNRMTAAISGTNADDDEAGIVLSTTSVSTNEGGATNTVEVSLMSEPTRAVTLRLSSSDTGEARVSPPALTFRAGNWDTNQAFTVTGRNDDVDDGNQDYTIAVTAGSGDSGYNGRTETISGVNVDDDEAGFVLDPVSGNSLGTIAEDGGTARFTAVLGSRPVAGTRVVLGVESSSAGRAGVSRAALTFTSSNWSRPQTVTVRGVSNDISDRDETVEVAVSVAAAPATTDPGYTAAGLAAQSLSVTVEDDNSPGFSLGGFSGSGLGMIAEDEGTARFTAVLRTEPSGTVVLGVGVTPSTDRISLSPVALTFDSSNWDRPQTVTVTGVANNVDDGNATVGVTVSVEAATTDPVYKPAMPSLELAPRSLSVTVEDDNFAGFRLDHEGDLEENTLPEVSLGGTVTFSAYLGAAPAQTVTVTLTATTTLSLDTVSFTPSTLTLTSYKAPQTITVSIAAEAEEEEFVFGIEVSTPGAGAFAAQMETLTVSVVRRGQPAMEAVQGALAVMDGAGGAQLAADLIADRARPGADEPRTVLGGADLLSGVDREGMSADREAEQESDPFGDRADFEARRPDVVRTLAGSGFSRNLGDSGDGGLSVWGAGAATDIEIRVDGHETEYDGNVFGAQIGVEMQAGAGVAVGVAVGASQGVLKVRNSGLRRIERDMLSLHPYLAWNSGDFSGWLAVGFGVGDYTVETEDGRAKADVSTTMLGAGVETRWEAGGFDLSARLSAVGSRSELDEALELPGVTDGVVPDGTKSEFWRLRAELEAGRTFEGDGGAVFRPYVTAGGRQDGGDGPTGGAGELGVGLRFELARSLTGDLSVRTQVTDADLKENSLSGSLRYDYEGDGRGLLLSAESERRYVDAEGDDGSEWSAVHRGRIGYGWGGSMLGRAGLAELYMSGSRGDGRRGPRLGAEFDAPPLSLGISGGSEEMRLEMDYRF